MKLVSEPVKPFDLGECYMENMGLLLPSCARLAILRSSSSQERLKVVRKIYILACTSPYDISKRDVVALYSAVEKLAGDTEKFLVSSYV